MRSSSPPTAGFSLVELSIVLAILGLLLGAILAGQNILKQFELKTIIRDYTQYSNAVTQFSKQYGGLPGDLGDATSYWGDDNTACPDAAIANGTPGTCNGNGDSNMSTVGEPYRAWQQLALAGYIQGSFTGVTGGGSPAHSLIGTNVPKARITNAGWSFAYKPSTAGDANQFDQDLSNFLAFGAPVANGLTQAAAITPSEAWQIDTKMDNGLPGSGRVVSLKPASLANCATNATDANAQYKLSYTDIACGLNMSLTGK